MRWLDHAQMLQVLDADSVRTGLPLNGSPSTHILKPPIAAIDGSVFNEAFCMALAGASMLGCALTIRRLTASQDEEQPPQAA